MKIILLSSKLTKHNKFLNRLNIMYVCTTRSQDDKKKFYKCYASYKYILSILILLGLDSSNALCGNNVKIKTSNSINNDA